MKGTSCAGVFVLLLAVGGTIGSPVDGRQNVPEPIPTEAPEVPLQTSSSAPVEKMTTMSSNPIKDIKIPSAEGLVEKTVRTNFLNTLFLMANASAVTGAQVSRAAGTIIRGFVQDSFNLVSIGAYLPRLIFLDGPTQFIEIMRLVRTNQIRLIPQDIDEAMDTLINFADIVRASPISSNLGTSFLSFFPNVFRGVELLSTELLYGVFSWFGPLSPSDISSASVEGLWNRWDVKSSTTVRSTYRLPTKPAEF